MKFTLTKDGNKDKKQLVSDISAILGKKAKYNGPPEFTYSLGAFLITKSGDLITDGADENEAEQLIAELTEKGYEGEAEKEFPGVSIGYPRKKISDAGIERLKKFLEAKEDLIKKALGIESIALELDDEQVKFPWFEGEQTPEDIKAYTDFICYLCKFAEKQKRVTAQKQEVENEKYAFRCVLLRIGMIGDDTKETRKQLMRRLEGSASFKSAKKKDAGEEPAEETMAQDGASNGGTAGEDEDNE